MTNIPSEGVLAQLDNQDLPLDDKLINLLCSPEAHNRALAFQLAHKKEAMYPMFWEFVGKVWSLMPACPMPKNLEKRIKKWEEVVSNVTKIDCHQTHFLRELGTLRVFFNLSGYKTETIQGNDLFFLPTPMSFVSIKSTLPKQHFLNVDVLQGVQMRKLVLNNIHIEKIPTMPLPFESYFRNCIFDENDLINFQPDNNIRTYSRRYFLDFSQANLKNGIALARMLNQIITVVNTKTYFDLRISGTPLVQKQESLLAFCDAIEPDVRKKITLYVGKSKKINHFKLNTTYHFASISE